MKVNQVQFKWLTTCAIWIIYAIALASPAISFFKPFLGIQALRIAWEGVNIIPELANITLLLGWVLLMFDRVHWAVIVATFGLLFALSALALYGSALLYGYYVWLSSHALLLGATLLGVVRFGRASDGYGP